MEKTTMVKMEKKTLLKMLKKVLEKNLMIAYLDELRSFLGIIIASGYVCLPNFADYWETNSIFSQSGIVKGMSQNCFEQLCGWLYFNDKSLAPAYGTPGYDKLYKIRSVIDAVRDKSKTLYNLGQNVSVDKAMVKFKGRSSL